MVKFSIAIKTHRRPGGKKDYLPDTLDNLERAGVPEEIVQLSIGEGKTLHQNAQNAIRMAGEADCDYAIVLEDDLDFCNNFLDSLERWLQDFSVEHTQMYVLGANYAQIQMVHERQGDGAWAYPVGGFYGAQALVWRKRDALQLAEWLGPDPDYNGTKNHGHDLKLQQWGKKLGIDYFTASVPCMVQHIGEQSGIGNRFFQFPWGGREWSYKRKAA